jgi:DNA modification methylase
MTVTDSSLTKKDRERQLLEDGTIHRWYRFVLAFPDHLVTEMCERFNAAQGDIVLDPFCGTGTTLVECQKMGLDAIGLEANPASVFASQVKTTWDIDAAQMRAVLQEIVERVRLISEKLTFSAQPLFAGAFSADNLKKQLLAHSTEGQYFVSSGMLKRGWLSEIPFYKTLALLNQIKTTECEDRIKDTLKLALVAILTETVSNVSFGPEIYVSGRKDDVDVLGAFRDKVKTMISDLEAVQAIFPVGQSLVLSGDARECAHVLAENDVDGVDFVITSPPYPTEKDYTRQTRLELVFLGYVYNTQSLRRIKQTMVRSHSKGIYKADDDGKWVANIPEVRAIADELRAKVKDKTYGFAKLYPRIIEEYFGGMYCHLRSLNEVLRNGGRCAYVVGEQRTYLQTYTPTGRILGMLAERIGFEVADMLTWRVRKGTTGSGKEIKEQIVILRKPG